MPSQRDPDLRVARTHAAYVREFGLELTRYDGGARAVHMQGKRLGPPPAAEPWPLDGSPPVSGTCASARLTFLDEPVGMPLFAHR